jgi:beta-glucuronidase
MIYTLCVICIILNLWDFIKGHISQISGTDFKRRTIMQETNDFLTADYERKYYNKEITADSLIFTGGRKTISLNGEWNYTLDQYDTCLRQNWENEVYSDSEGRSFPVDFSFDTWDKVTLPCSMNLFRPEYFWYEGPFVFTRKFSYNLQGSKEGHVFLRIGAANYTCRVFFNKEYLGQHRGGSTPFMFDITEYIKSENRIIIVSDNTRRHTCVPTENTDWFNYSGIYRDIELVEVPKKYIRDFRIGLVPGSEYRKIECSFDTSENDGSVILQIPGLDIEKTVEIKDGKGRCEIDAPEKLSLWSPDNPVLYDINASYYEDSVSDTVGFREILVSGNDILLNGEKIFLRGISVHEDSYYTGKALTDEEREEIVKTARDLGANYLRLAHYPHNEAMAKLCDR